MFKLTSTLTDTAVQSLSLLAKCSVNATLVKVVPFLEQSFFQMMNVTDPAAVHSLLQIAPDCSRRLAEATDHFFREFTYHFLSIISFLQRWDLWVKISPILLWYFAISWSTYGPCVIHDVSAVRACIEQVIWRLVKIKNLLNGTTNLYKIR